MKKELKINRYPSHFTDSVIRKVKMNVTNGKDNSLPLDRNKYISAPYIRDPSERAARILKKFSMKLSHKPSKTLSY